MIRNFALGLFVAALLLGGFFIVLLYSVPARAKECGVASYYCCQFHGRRTASGERFDQNAMTAAHRSMAFGTKVRVTYRGKSVVVRVSDRGPFVRGRIIDLSRGAAKKLGLIPAGVGKVCIERIGK